MTSTYTHLPLIIFQHQWGADPEQGPPWPRNVSEHLDQSFPGSVLLVPGTTVYDLEIHSCLLPNAVVHYWQRGNVPHFVRSTIGGHIFVNSNLGLLQATGNVFLAYVIWYTGLQGNGR